MTTPERLRRRQRRESAGLAILAISLAASVVYFNGEDEAQRECLLSYIEADSETSKIRSDLVLEESKTFRQVIRGAGTATSREEFDAALAEAEASWRSIDRQRAANPVRVFDPQVDCP